MSPSPVSPITRASLMTGIERWSASALFCCLSDYSREDKNRDEANHRCGKPQAGETGNTGLVWALAD
jgi:hypothetical protein